MGNEMLNMPYIKWWPLTPKRILEEVNGRNCPCIHCLRYPGELLFLNETNWQFYENNEFLYLTEHNGYDWDGCICEGPVPEGEPEGEPEPEFTLPEGEPESEPETEQEN